MASLLKFTWIIGSIAIEVLSKIKCDLDREVNLNVEYIKWGINSWGVLITCESLFKSWGKSL